MCCIMVDSFLKICNIIIWEVRRYWKRDLHCGISYDELLRFPGNCEARKEEQVGGKDIWTRNSDVKWL